MNIPNTLSLLRLACAPLLIAAAWTGMPAVFFFLLTLMLFSDALDGYLARLWHQTSALGARLDSLGDYATYLGIAAGAWLLWPERIMREAGPVLLMIAVYLLPLIVSLAKFRRLNSYHTLLTKITAVTVSITIVLFLVIDSIWPIYLAIAMLMLEAVENIAITLKLKHPQTDIRSYWEL